MDYESRNDYFSKILYEKLALKYSLQNDSNSYYKYNPSKV
jgi:hypothetical protein